MFGLTLVAPFAFAVLFYPLAKKGIVQQGFQCIILDLAAFVLIATHKINLLVMDKNGGTTEYGAIMRRDIWGCNLTTLRFRQPLAQLISVITIQKVSVKTGLTQA